MTTSIIDARGDEVDFATVQGSSFKITLTITDSLGAPIDLTGNDIRAQFRKSYSSTSADINCTLANSKLSLTSPTLGKFALVLLPADTSAIRFLSDSPDELDLVYDIEVTRLDGTTFKPLHGTLTLQREVTR